MKHLTLLIVFGLTGTLALAQSSSSSGIKLLEIGPTATELSRSEAAVATPNGAASMYSNPALLVLNETSTINLGYTNWILDSSNLFGGINFNNKKRAFAFGFYTSGVTGLEQRNQPGDPNAEFSIQHISLSGGYAHNFNILSLGFSGHYINEDVYPYRANGYAFSVGAAATLFENKVSLGTSLLNMGEMEPLNREATSLPTSFNIGIAMDVLQVVHPKSPDLPILATIMADFVAPLTTTTASNDYIPDNNYFNLGLSLTISEVVVVNAGYKTQDNKRPYSFGVGFIAEKVQFNYALVPFNTGFGTVHSIGLQYKL